MRACCSRTGQKNCSRPQGNRWHFGTIRGAVDRLNDIHNLFRAQLASGKMTDADYAKKARELLNILGDFDGLIADAVNGIPQQ